MTLHKSSPKSDRTVACDLTVIVVVNGPDGSSSNAGRGCLGFIFLSIHMGKAYNYHFSLLWENCRTDWSKSIDLGEGKR